MNAARIISPSSSTDNRRAKPTLDAGQKNQRPESLNIAAFFARHSWPLSHQSSTAENVAAASFDRTTAHPPRSAPARERCGSSGLRSAHLDRVRVPELVRARIVGEPPPQAAISCELTPGGAGRPGVSAGGSGDHAEQRADRQRPRWSATVRALPRPRRPSPPGVGVALTVPDQNRPAPFFQIGLVERERLVDP